MHSHPGSCAVSLKIHPDALYDQPYTTEELRTDSYRSLDFSGALETVPVEGGVELRSAQARLRITAPMEGTLRIQAIPGKSEIPVPVTEKLGLVRMQGAPALFSWKLQQRSLQFTTPRLKVLVGADSGEISVWDEQRGVLLQTLRSGLRFSNQEPDYATGHRMLAHFAFKEENIFGFGGRIVPPLRNGTSVDVFDMKVGVTTEDYGGCPVPFFLSTKGYGFFLNNPWPHVYFDMGKTVPDEWFCHAPGGDCDLFVFAGPQFSDIMRQYTALTGRPPLPERWWLGFWCSSLTFCSASEVVETAKRLRAENYPCEAIVLDGPWRGGPNFVKSYSEGREYISKDFDWHEDFGDGAAMIRDLKALGFRVILHVNSRNFSPESAEAGVAGGLLRQHGKEVVVRLGNLAAEAHYESLLAPRIDDGVELWWTDHADRISGELSEGIPSRNLFGALWNRLVFDIMRRHGKENRPCLTRGSGIGGQRWGLPWPGDTRVGIDAFADDLWFCINAGLGGFALTSVDLGGFTLRNEDYASYPSDAERLAEALNDENICRRVCQSIVLVPIPRIHNNWTTVAKFPWRCSERTQQLYRESLEFRYSLMPYFYHFAIRAALTGEPILRPLAYHHPHDPESVRCGDQLYLGDQIIAAPILTPGTLRRKVYLPEGRWINWWTGTVHAGLCFVEVNVPLYELSGLPLFIKCGAIIPRQDTQPFLEPGAPSHLTFAVFPGESTEMELWEGLDQTLLLRLDCTPTSGTFTVQNRHPGEKTVSLRLPHGWNMEEGAADTATIAPGGQASFEMHLATRG